jgi:hypothetical protein
LKARRGKVKKKGVAENMTHHLFLLSLKHSFFLNREHSQNICFSSNTVNSLQDPLKKMSTFNLHEA